MQLAKLNEMTMTIGDKRVRAMFGGTELHAAFVVEVEVRNVYGDAKAYPVNANAMTFAKIAGTKTLTRATLMGIIDLGYEIISRADADWRKVA